MAFCKLNNSEASAAGTDEASNLSTNFEVIDMSSIATQIATINVPFHGASLYVVSHNGEPYTPMKPIVEGMGMDWASQFTKLKKRFAKGIVAITIPSKGGRGTMTPSKGVMEIAIPSAGGKQAMTCLALRKLNGWLQTISPNKVKPEIRETVIQYQEECDDVLYEYWTKGQVTNPRKAKKIAAGKITADQQEAIKQLVMNRGKALPKENQAKAIITMWSSLKSHFGCTYKEISENQFTEALSLAARVPLEGEFIAKQCALPSEPVRKQFTDEELINLSYMWIWMDKGQRVSKAIYPAMKQIGSAFSGYFYDMGHETRYMTEKAREALIRETANIDMTEHHARRAKPMLDKLNGKKELH